jgi:hypothetical protein
MSRPISLRTRHNTQMAAALHRSVEALVELDRLGCEVHALVIKDARPVVLIAPPPGDLVGAVHMHRNKQGKREAVWMATVAGCNVEWTAPQLMTLVTS